MKEGKKTHLMLGHDEHQHMCLIDKVDLISDYYRHYVYSLH